MAGYSLVLSQCRPQPELVREGGGQARLQVAKLYISRHSVMSCSHTKLGLPASQRGRLAGWLTVRLVRHSLITQAGPSPGEVKSTVWYGVTMDIVVCKCALCTVHSQYIFTCCPAGLTAGSHNLISSHHYQHTAINPPDYNCCLRFSLELGIEIIQSISPFKLMFWIRFMKLLELCPHI